MNLVKTLIFIELVQILFNENILSSNMIVGNLTDYKDTNQGGDCDGMNQSPINIKTQDV